jgi:hypothetical protein
MVDFLDETLLDETLSRRVRDGFAQINKVEVIRDAIRITTHCLYPSNGLVRVYVRQTGSTAIVSDEHGAFNEVQSAGVGEAMKDRALAHLVTPLGLMISNGTVYAPGVTPDAIVGTAILVANASRAVAEWIYDHFRVKRERDFKLLLSDLLQRNFETIWHRKVKIPGVNKSHEFANVLAFPDGRQLLIDPVGNEPASYNSRIIANLDVKARQDPLIEQRIVYDDAEKWSPDNLNLLSMGAIAIPFSRTPEVLKRLAVAV